MSSCSSRRFSDDPGTGEVGVHHVEEPAAQVYPPELALDQRPVDRLVVSAQGTFAGAEEGERRNRSGRIHPRPDRARQLQLRLPGGVSPRRRPARRRACAERPAPSASISPTDLTLWIDSTSSSTATSSRPGSAPLRISALRPGSRRASMPSRPGTKALPVQQGGQALRRILRELHVLGELRDVRLAADHGCLDAADHHEGLAGRQEHGERDPVRQGDLREDVGPGQVGHRLVGVDGQCGQRVVVDDRCESLSCGSRRGCGRPCRHGVPPLVGLPGAPGVGAWCRAGCGSVVAGRGCVQALSPEIFANCWRIP